MPINIEYRPNALLTTWGAYRGGRAAGKRENAQMQLQQSMQNQRIVADTFNNVTGQMFSMARQQQDFRNRQTLNQDAYNFAIGQMDHGAQIDARQFAERSIGEPWDVIEYNAAQQGKIPTDYVSGRIAEQQEFQKQSWLAAHNAEEGFPDDYGQQLTNLAQQEAEAEIKFGTGEISPQEYDTTLGAIGAERQRVMNTKVIKAKQPKMTYNINGKPVQLGPYEGLVGEDFGSLIPDGKGSHDLRPPADQGQAGKLLAAQQYHDATQKFNQLASLPGADRNKAFQEAYMFEAPDGSWAYITTEGPRPWPANSGVMKEKAAAAVQAQWQKDMMAAAKIRTDLIKALVAKPKEEGGYTEANAEELAWRVSPNPPKPGEESQQIGWHYQGRPEWAYEAPAYSSATAVATQPSAADNEEWGPVTIEKGYRIQRSTSGKVRVLN